GGDVRFRALRVEGGDVHLDAGDGGELLLAEAFAPKEPSTTGSTLPAIVFDELAIDGVDVLRGGEAIARAVAARLHARIVPTGIDLQGDASATLRGWEPRIGVALEASLGGGWQALAVSHLDVATGDSTLSLRGEADLATMEATISGIDAVLSGAELERLLPGAAGLDGLRLRGDASLGRGVIRAAADLDRGRDLVQVEGQLALLTGAWRVAARSTGLDPRAIDAELPPAILDGEVEVSGTWGEVETARLRGVTLRMGAAGAGPIDAELEKRDGTWTIESFAGAFPGGAVSGSGRVGYELASLRFRLEVRQLERALAAGDAWAEALGFDRIGHSGVFGSFTAGGKVEGRLDAPAITAQVRAPRIGRGDLVAEDVEIEGRWAGLPGRKKAKVSGVVGRVSAGGSSADAVRMELELGGGRARGVVEGRSALGAIRAALDAGVSPDLTAIRFDSLALEWPGARWSSTGTPTVTLGAKTMMDARFAGSRGGDLELQLAVGGGRWSVDAKGAGVALDGLPPIVGLDEIGLTGTASFEARLSSEGISLEGSLDGVELRDIRALGGDGGRTPAGAGQQGTAAMASAGSGGTPVASRGVRGLARATLRAEGPWSAPVLEAHLEIPDFDVEGVEAFGLSAHGTWPGAGPSPEASVSYTVSHAGAPLATGGLRLEADLDSLGKWRELPVHATARIPDLALERIRTLLPAGWPGLDVAGSGDLSLSIAGTASRPDVEAEASLREVVWEGRALGEASLRAACRRAACEASLRGSSRAGGEASIDASFPLELGIEALEAGRVPSLVSTPFDARVRVEGAELGILRAFLPDLRQLAGKLHAEGTWSGSIRDPRIAGTLSVREGRIGHERIGELRDVELDLEARPDRLILRRLQARSSGLLQATGEAIRSSEGGPFDLDLTLDARRFAVVSNDVARASVDARGRVKGSLTSRLLDAELEIVSGVVRLPDRPGRSIQSLDPHPDFHVAGSVELAATRGERDSERDAFQLRLHVTTRQPLLLEGIDLSIAADADLRLFHDADGLRLTGAVETARGNLVVMGRRFDLQRGKVSYLGTEGLDAPRLEITAVQESPHAQVTVTVGGTAQKPTADLRSNPPMSEAEIATLLATGRPQLQHGSGGVGEASGAATALGAVVTSQLRRGIAAKLPVDVISVQAGEEGLETGSLEAGSYVTDRIYVGYSRNFGVLESDRRNANEVRVEYQLHRQWTLEVTYGDRGAGDAGVFWKRDFR
ncbi:MAG TPA: translocation/assembly module TamB domain-containing protein, partial [Vulgatibacter sp.]